MFRLRRFNAFVSNILIKVLFKISKLLSFITMRERLPADAVSFELNHQRILGKP